MERDARFALPAWALGGALLIGGIWPWALGVMLGAGLGPPGYDLSRFASEPVDRKSARELSPAERGRLATLEAEMEERLRNPDPTATTQPQPQSRRDRPTTTPQLGDEPLHPQAPQAAPEKQFDGEFYPTETHVKHK